MAEKHEIVGLEDVNRDDKGAASFSESSSGAHGSRFVAPVKALTGPSEEEAVQPPEPSERSAASSSSSSSGYYSARIESMLQSRSEFASEVDWEIETSKDHWSELAPRSEELSSDPEDEREHLTNGEIVESLRRKFPQLDTFFRDGAGFVLGEKIAVGGQAEIFAVGPGSVVKVFKEGLSVRDLQKQWPLGMINWLTERNRASRAFYRSPLRTGTVLMNGRFAFLMHRFWGDLRKLMDKRMERNSNRCPPFTDDGELVQNMYQIAEGMKSLHEDNIIHRDLKAANVLVRMSPFNEKEGWYTLHIADYECSVGVVGTRFWRAPEILQGVKYHKITSDLFTKKSDVYSFAMICYELVTGKIPFGDRPLNDYDVVLLGGRPILPEGTKPWIKELLSRCWHHDPSERPDFADIVKVFADK